MESARPWTTIYPYIYHGVLTAGDPIFSAAYLVLRVPHLQWTGNVSRWYRFCTPFLRRSSPNQSVLVDFSISVYPLQMLAGSIARTPGKAGGIGAGFEDFDQVPSDGCERKLQIQHLGRKVVKCATSWNME